MNSLRLLDRLLAPPSLPSAPAHSSSLGSTYHNAAPDATPTRHAPAPRLFSSSAWPTPNPDAKPAPQQPSSPWRRRRRLAKSGLDGSRFRRRLARLWGFQWPARILDDPYAASSSPCHPIPSLQASSSSSAPCDHSYHVPCSSSSAAAVPVAPGPTQPDLKARQQLKFPPNLQRSESDHVEVLDDYCLPARAQDDNQTLVSTHSSGSDQLSLCETLVASDQTTDKVPDPDDVADHVPLPPTPSEDPPAACVLVVAQPDVCTASGSHAYTDPGVGHTVDEKSLTAAAATTTTKAESELSCSLLQRNQVRAQVEASLDRIVYALALVFQAIVRVHANWIKLTTTKEAYDSNDAPPNDEKKTPNRDMHHETEPNNQNLPQPSQGNSPPSRLLADPHGGNSALPMGARRPSPPPHVGRTPIKAQVVDSTPKTLVLDLDETLIHSVARSASRDGPRSTFGLNSALGVPRRMFGSGLATLGLGPAPPGFSSLGGTTSVEVVLGGRSVVYTVHKRPGVDAFLAQVAEWYSVVVFTASVREYADPVIDWLDSGRGLFQGRLFRDSCIYKNGAYIKDLAAVVRQTPASSGVEGMLTLSQEEDHLRRVCLLDNSPASWRLHPANGIPIEGWTHDPYDTALMDLLPVLDSLRFCDDVRHVLGIRLLATETAAANAARAPSSTASGRRSVESPVSSSPASSSASPATASSTAIKAR